MQKLPSRATRSSSSPAAWRTATRSTPPPARSSSTRRNWITERKGVSRCIAAARTFLRVIQDHVQNGGLVGDVAVGVGGVALKADAFARLNDNGLLISRDFDCTGEKGDKLGGTPQMRLRLPMAAGSQLHIVDGELPVFIVRKKAVRRYIENYQKPDFDLAIQGTLRYHKLNGVLPTAQTTEAFQTALSHGQVTEKEKALWEFVLSAYGDAEFSTKQLEKDFGNAAYATIRSFVLKFEKLGLLKSTQYGNRVKYAVRVC